MRRPGSAPSKPLRTIILLAFIGATFWVFVPLLNIGSAPSSLPAPVPLRTSAGDQFVPRRASNETGDSRRHLRSGDARREIVVVAVCAIAWVLAGMVKPE